MVRERPLRGPGDFLHDRIKKWFAASPYGGCNCAGRIKQMNAWGVEGCRTNIDTIVGWLQEEAKKHHWLTKLAAFMPGSGYTIKQFILGAIDEAEAEAVEKEQAEQVEPVDESVNYPVDVVYTLSNESRWGDNELRYSLRSLEKYCKNLGRVFVVGHKPGWLTGVLHIPHDDWKKGHPEYKKRKGDVGHKDGNIIRKVLRACETDLTERFLFASDDQVFLTPVNACTLPARHTGKLRPTKQRGVWRRRVDHTREYLESKGIEGYAFDSHVITPHTKAEFVAAVKASDYDRGQGYTINTLTQNQNPKIAVAPLGHMKAGFDRPLTAEQVSAAVKGKTYLGYSNGGLGEGLKTVLAELFPEPSRYEKEEIVTNTTPLRRGNTRSLILPEELDALLEVMRGIPAGGRFLEIGTYHGLTARRLAEARPDVTVFCVDPMRKWDNKKWQSNRTPNMRLLVGTVSDILALGVANQFDAALVDGDHHYEPCLTDLRACASLVKPGGVLAAHDYRAVPGTHVKGKEQVKRAVDDYCAKTGVAVSRLAGSLAFLSTSS